MSGFGDAIQRKFYQAKTHLGAGQKTNDSDMQYSKNKLMEEEKKFKNILNVVKKLPATVHACNLMQVEVLTSLGDIVQDTNKDVKSTLDGVIQTFQTIDEGVNTYEQRIENDVCVPLKTYLEQYDTMKKRFDICHNRRIDMDRFHDSVLSISKKPPGKQSGLGEAQNKYNTARDLYNYLKEELIADVQKLTSDSDHVINPIAGTLLVAYTEYLNHLNQNWGNVANVTGRLTIAPVDPQAVITPGEASMAIDANVFSKKSADISNGTYQGESSETSPTNSTPMSTANNRPAPPTPQRRPAPPVPGRGPKREQVRCQYDYDAQEQGELSFKEGDVIDVIKKDGDWWTGSLRGVQGIFPSNYVAAIF